MCDRINDEVKNRRCVHVLSGKGNGGVGDESEEIEALIFRHNNVANNKLMYVSFDL